MKMAAEVRCKKRAGREANTKKGLEMDIGFIEVFLACIDAVLANHRGDYPTAFFPMNVRAGVFLFRRVKIDGVSAFYFQGTK